MRVIVLFAVSVFVNLSQAQVKLCLDSTLKVAYIKKYGFSDGLMCMPFYCDPFCQPAYKKGDTVGYCGKFVFVNRDFVVKVKPVFDIPCGFEPRFSEGLCAVSIKNQLCFIDTLGQVKIVTDLLACSNHRNRILPFKNGKAKVYKGSGTLKNYYDVYYIDKDGKRIREPLLVHVRKKPLPMLVSGNKKDTTIRVAVNDVSPDTEPELLSDDFFEIPRSIPRGKYPMTEGDLKMYLKSMPHRDNRMLIYFECGPYQIENMAEEDTVYCGKFVFTDTFLNVKIAGGFNLPCGFEPEFSEGLCAVAKNNYLVYIDTTGQVIVNTGLKACDTVLNKASTFKNGIATLYVGDKRTRGLYTTQAINTKGERVRLLEFDDLDLAEKFIGKFKNLLPEECNGCFIGKGKTNGLWFLVEKSGKVRKKLELK
ncbi:MAG: hypothetical protein ACKOXF_01095 [Chitinophagaceae bacterium]